MGGSGGGWCRWAAGGVNAQVQLVSWPQGDMSDKSSLGPGPFCAAGPPSGIDEGVSSGGEPLLPASRPLADGWTHGRTDGRKHTHSRQAGVRPASHDTSEEHV